MLIKNRSFSAEKISQTTSVCKENNVYSYSLEAINLEMSQDSVDKNMMGNFVG
jgi:hypothetical protein